MAAGAITFEEWKKAMATGADTIEGWKKFLVTTVRYLTSRIDEDAANPIAAQITYLFPSIYVVHEVVHSVGRKDAPEAITTHFCLLGNFIECEYSLLLANAMLDCASRYRPVDFSKPRRLFDVIRIVTGKEFQLLRGEEFNLPSGSSLEDVQEWAWCARFPPSFIPVEGFYTNRAVARLLWYFVPK